MATSCTHLDQVRDVQPRTPEGCEECLKEGTKWVELRECRACRHVGCCDSSPRKHATLHFHETHHPVMRAVPPAAWTWCYVHEAMGQLGTGRINRGRNAPGRSTRHRTFFR